MYQKLDINKTKRLIVTIINIDLYMSIFFLKNKKKLHKQLKFRNNDKNNTKSSNK